MLFVVIHYISHIILYCILCVLFIFICIFIFCDAAETLPVEQASPVAGSPAIQSPKFCSLHDSVPVPGPLDTALPSPVQFRPSPPRQPPLPACSQRAGASAPSYLDYARWQAQRLDQLGDAAALRPNCAVALPPLLSSSQLGSLNPEGTHGGECPANQTSHVEVRPTNPKARVIIS